MPQTSIMRIHADQAESNTPAGDLLGATAEMLHRLRGGVNPRVQAQIQAIADDMAQQGKLSSVLDFPPETSALLDIPETLQARQFQRKQQQSWGDWLYEKTVTKVADLMGKSRPSQRQIEDQLDETLATLNRKSGRQKESTHPQL